MKMLCAYCGQERDAEQDFHWRYKARCIRQTKCKYCVSEGNKAHYQKNKKIYVTRSHIRDGRIELENKQKIYHYLLHHPCVDCGITDIRVLEFDHVRGKKRENIAQMVRSFSWPTIAIEIAKCEVRCANCHRLKTLERGNYWRFKFNPSE